MTTQMVTHTLRQPCGEVADKRPSPLPLLTMVSTHLTPLALISASWLQATRKQRLDLRPLTPAPLTGEGGNIGNWDVRVYKKYTWRSV